MEMTKTQKIGAQLYTVRDFTQTAEDMKATLKKTADMGFGLVQLSSHNFEIDPAAIKSWCDEYGLRIGVTHMKQPEDFKANLDKTIAMHRVWNCNYIGLGSMPNGWNIKTVAEIKDFLSYIVPAAEKIRDAGMHFVYHNHSFEFDSVEGTTIMDYFLDHTDPDVFMLLADIAWIQAGGVDPAQFIRENRRRIHTVHYKDYTMIDGKAEPAEVGSGLVNWQSVTAACKEIGVQQYQIEQDRNFAVDCFESLRTSKNYMMGLGIE
jgi:sugar phosphate isomerase/epimerase